MKTSKANRDLEARQKISSQQKLRESEELYHLILANSSDAVFITDSTGAFTFICPNVSVIFGYTEPEVADLGTIDNLLGSALFDPDLLARQGEITNIERRIEDQARQPHDLLVTVKAIAIGRGTVMYTCHDITDRKQAEADLQSSEEKFRCLVDCIDADIILVDAIGQIQFANPSAARNLGLEPAALVGRNLFDLLPRNVAAQQLELIREVLRTGSQQVTQISLKVEGEERWFRTSILPVHDSSGLIKAAQIVATDITDFKIAEVAVRQSETRLRGLINSQTNYVLHTDLDGCYTYTNDKFSQDFGWLYPETGIDGSSSLNSIQPYHHDRTLEAVTQCMAEPGKIVRVELDKPWPDGTTRTTLWEFVCLPDDHGLPSEIQCMGIDITERVTVERALSASEQRYRQMFEAVKLPKLILDPVSGAVLGANPAAVDFYGYNLDTLKTMNITDINVASPEMITQKMQAVLAGKTEYCDFPQLRSDGTVRAAQAYPTIIELDGKEAIYVTYIDVTERNQAKAELQSAYASLEQRVTERTVELERTKDRMEAIFQHSGDSIVLLHVEQGIQQANYVFCATFCLPESNWIGKNLSDFFQQDNVDSIDAQVQAVVNSHQMRQIEAWSTGAHGSRLEVEISIAPVNRSEQAVNNLVCIIRDITERKRLEHTLTEKLNELDRFFTVALDLLCIADTNGNFLKVNRAWETILGYSAEELEGRSFLDFVHPDDLPATLDAITSLSDQRQVLQFINRYRSQDGSYRFIEWRSHPYQNLIYAAARDITERKHIEDELRDSEQRYRSTLTAMSEGLIVVEADGTIQLANEAAERILGLTLAQITDQADLPPGWQAIHEDGSPFPIDDYLAEAVKAPRKHLVMGVVKPDATCTWILINVETLDADEGHGSEAIITFTDITNLKHTQAELESKHQKELEIQSYLKALHETTIMLTRTNTLDEFYRLVVEQGIAEFGFERVGMLLCSPDTTMVHGTYGTDAHGRVVDEHHLRFRPGDLTGLLQKTLDRGRRFAFEPETDLFEFLQPIGKGQNAVAALWNDDQVLGWLAIDNGVHRQPISPVQLEILALYALTVGSLMARKQAEQQTQELSQRLELATRAGSIGTWDWLIREQRVIWDEGMERIYGVTAAEDTDLFSRLAQLLHPDDVLRVSAQVDATVATAQPLSTEFRILRNKGSELRYVQTSAIAVRGEDGQTGRLVGVCLDVTSIRLAEQTLRSALAKEKELGDLKSRFVSMASHEFRTPLAGILVAADSLAIYRDRMTPPQIDARIDRIRELVGYMKELMEDVLQLARIQADRAEFRPALGDFQSFCREIIEDFEGQEQFSGRIVYDGPDEPLQIAFDKRLMRHVVTNLIHNALKYSLDDQRVHVSIQQTEAQITLSVRDEGIGIPDADLKHLFEPFHRASNVGSISGTGLGLSITKRAVEGHGGTISVESAIDRGTTFTIVLPKVVAEA